jgi:kinesin family protein 2/24
MISHAPNSILLLYREKVDLTKYIEEH